MPRSKYITEESVRLRAKALGFTLVRVNHKCQPGGERYLLIRPMAGRVRTGSTASAVGLYTLIERLARIEQDRASHPK